MRVCSPHCGIAPESGSGGEVYERDLLKGLAGLGEECHILLARGKPYEQEVQCWTVHPVWPPKGLRWYVTPFVWPRYIKRVWDEHGFDLLRAHSVRYVGPAALLARRRYRLPIPVVTHHHHLDPSPLNPLGLKGAGEGGVNAAGATIAAAIDDALGMPGAVKELPVTPQRLRALLRSQHPG